MTPICLVGIGKIAVDQHVPAIGASKDWTLAATVSRAGSVEGVQAFTDFDEMLLTRPDIRVVSLCLPPVPRFAYAAKAISAGRHVMLEKPPGATLAEVQALCAMAEDANVSLFATWHSRMSAAVQPAKDWLVDKQISRVEIIWKEDVRRWHPGQDWVFEPGGMGVFDPGINGLSILTEILPQPMRLLRAELQFPENRETPIAANLLWSGNMTGDFDWRQEGPQRWDITVETDSGRLEIRDGGARLSIAGEDVVIGPNREYPALYERMSAVMTERRTDVDLSPMVQVADAFCLGKRLTVAPFHF